MVLCLCHPQFSIHLCPVEGVVLHLFVCCSTCVVDRNNIAGPFCVFFLPTVSCPWLPPFIVLPLPKYSCPCSRTRSVLVWSSHLPPWCFSGSVLLASFPVTCPSHLASHQVSCELPSLSFSSEYCSMLFYHRSGSHLHYSFMHPLRILSPSTKHIMD